MQGESEREREIQTEREGDKGHKSDRDLFASVGSIEAFQTT